MPESRADSGIPVQVQDISVGDRPGRGDTLGFDAAGIDYDHLGPLRWGWHEMLEARQPSVDTLDLNVWGNRGRMNQGKHKRRS